MEYRIDREALMPAWAARRRNSLRTAALDHGLPRVGPSMTQNSGPTGSSMRAASQGRSCSQPGVHADLAAAAALAVAHEQRPAPGVEVAFAERERFLDAQPAAPEHDDQGAQASAVAVGAGLAHHRDDLLHGRRIGWVAQPLVARRTAGVVAGERRRRAATPGGIENSGYGHGILLPSHSG